jgi:hypothetical protein
MENSKEVDVRSSMNAVIRPQVLSPWDNSTLVAVKGALVNQQSGKASGGHGKGNVASIVDYGKLGGGSRKPWPIA